jgi:basic membrane protein A and related proteins
VPVRRAITLAILAAISLTAAAGAGGAPSERRPLRVGVVIPAAVIAEGAAGRAVVKGVERAVDRLGVSARVLTPGWKEGFGSSLGYLGRQRYDLVIAASMAPDEVRRVAPRFPDTTFASLDFPVEELGSSPNVRGTVFHDEQAGYLAGYLAGLLERRRPGRDVVSSVGGHKIPQVDHFIAGFQAGARRASPGARILNGYSDDFIDPARCRAVARSQIARGSRVVFQVAGRCGLGTLEAARVGGVWGIGVDSDQASVGPQVLTSALKRFDVAVFETIRAAQRRALAGGRNTVFDLENGGVGLGRISPKVPAAVVAQVRRVQRQIAAGSITIPTEVS